jgi:hypothetical protein
MVNKEAATLSAVEAERLPRVAASDLFPCQATAAAAVAARARNAG